MVGHEHCKWGYHHDNHKSNHFERRLFQPAEHHHGHTFINPCFDKGYGKHQATHDEPGSVGPVQHGYILPGHNPAAHGKDPYAEGHHWQRDRLCDKTDHHKNNDPDSRLNMKSGSVGFLFFFIRQHVIGKLVHSQIIAVFHEFLKFFRCYLTCKIFHLFHMRRCGGYLVAFAPFRTPFHKSFMAKRCLGHTCFHHPDQLDLPLRKIIGSFAKKLCCKMIHNVLRTHGVFHTNIKHAFRRWYEH